jgi:putative transcriptional regulator
MVYRWRHTNKRPGTAVTAPGQTTEGVTSMTKEDGNRIRALREASGMTQGELAAAVGAGRVTINRIEQGSQEPTLDLARKLAAALAGGSLDALLDTEVTS